jgi:hypothetical protein
MLTPMGPFDWISLAPRRWRRRFASALLVGFLVLPGPAHALFWWQVKVEARKTTSLLERAMEGVLPHTMHHRVAKQHRPG